MSEQPENTNIEIHNYEEYLAFFFPKTEQLNLKSKTPEELGIRMANKTLTQLQELLDQS